MLPEEKARKENKKKDVFMFGLLLLHLFYGAKPTKSFKPNEALKKLRETPPTGLDQYRVEALMKLIVICCRPKSIDRPGFNEIVDVLIALQIRPVSFLEIGNRLVVPEPKRTVAHYASLYKEDKLLAENSSLFNARDEVS